MVEQKCSDIRKNFQGKQWNNKFLKQNWQKTFDLYKKNQNQM